MTIAKCYQTFRTNFDGLLYVLYKRIRCLIRKTIEKTPMNADGTIIDVTMSFGCRQFDSELSIEENVSVADGFLYTAKESGRNCVIYEKNEK